MTQEMIDDRHRKSISILTDALSSFREIDPEMPMQTMITFLVIAGSGEKYPGGMPMTQLRLEVGISQAAISRNTALLSKGTGGRPGHRLILTREDPKHRRRKLVRISQKGLALVEQIHQAMEGKTR